MKDKKELNIIILSITLMAFAKLIYESNENMLFVYLMGVGYFAIKEIINKILERYEK